MHIDARLGRICWIENLPIVHRLLSLLFKSPSGILLSPDFTLLVLFCHLLNVLHEFGSYFGIGF